MTLAQWALESAYGVHLSGKNNPFGIKAAAGQPGTPRETWEVIDGRRLQMVQTFRDFASIADAFDAHGRLLATGKAYINARMVRTDAKAYARALTGRYATDPQYGAKLISIMDAADLYAFNVPARPVDVAIPTSSVRPPIIASPLAPAQARPVGFLARLAALFRKAA